MYSKKNDPTRREFLQKSAIGVTALSAGGLMASCRKTSEAGLPVRTLGKTGLQVSMLSFGGGSQFLKNEDGEWEQILERAIKLGINYYDTSAGYQWRASQSSEERFGDILPKYRNQIILSTKIDTRDVDEGLKQFERSLQRMKTDFVDILFLHSVEKDEDISAFENGLYREMVRLKDSGAARFIGFSSMNSAEKSKELMESLDIDVAILAMNPTSYGDFTKIALPVAIEKNIGVVAMKVMRDLVGKEATATELLAYAWTQPGVATAVVGHYGLQTLEENVGILREYREGKTASNSRNELENRLAHLAGPHALCWARPDYYDGMMV